MRDANQNKLFADVPKIIRMNRTLLLTGVICFVLVIITILCFSKPTKKASRETIESEQQENVQWVISNNKLPPNESVVKDEGLTLRQEQEEKLAKALEEIDKNNNLLVEKDTQSIDKARGSAISVEFTSEETRKNLAALSVGVIPAGTLLPMMLMTELTSDMPGEVLAQVTRSVYDTHQSHILIPQGTKILLSYDVTTSSHQDRIALKASTLILPSGNTQLIDGLVSIDPAGNAGISDKVDHHYVHNLVNIVVPNAANALSMPATQNGFDMNTIAQQFTTYHSPELLNSTIQIRRGKSFYLLVTKDIKLLGCD